MDKTVRDRLRMAAYFILAAMAIIFGLLAIYMSPPSSVWQNFLVNISTGFATVVIIFAIFTYFFIDSERDMATGFEQVKAMVQTPVRLFTTADPEETDFDFTAKLGRAETLDLVGYSMAHLFATYKHAIGSAINRGLRVRVMILDPTSTAGQLMSEKVGDVERVREPHERSVRYIDEIGDIANASSFAKGSLRVKFIPWIPSCYINIIDAGRPSGNALIGLNALSLRVTAPRRIHFILERSRDEAGFAYFRAQYDELWKSVEAEAEVAPPRESA